MAWTDFAKNRFVAPKVSALTECGAEPVELTGPRPETWLPAFVLNSMLRVSWADPARQLAFMIVRRVDAAIYEYETGRLELQSFVSQGSQLGVQRYSRALMHFEASVAVSYQAWMLVRQLADNKPKLFDKGDGTDIQRLNSLYNTSKHAAGQIASGHFAPESTLPIWIVNDGLQSTECHLSFAELAELLGSLGRIAGHLANPSSDSAE